MACVRRFQILGMRPSVRVNDAEPVRSAYIEDERALEFGHFDNFKTIRGADLARILLAIQLALLACVLLVSVMLDPARDPRGWASGVAAMIAVSAMGCQFALLRIALPGAPSTAVMTGNLDLDASSGWGD